MFAFNLGTGVVEGATEEHAETNIRHLITDCKIKDLRFVRVPEHDEGEGRFSFLLYRGTRCHLVEMPGLPLKQVRYMKGESPLSCPRLYVDGSSWLWEFALDILVEESFMGPEAD